LAKNCQLQAPAVEVAGEIQQEGFHQFDCAIELRTDTDAHGGRPDGVVAAGDHGVDAASWQQLALVCCQVGCWVAKLAATPVAGHDDAAEAVGTAEQLGGLCHLTVAHLLADRAATAVARRTVPAADGADGDAVPVGKLAQEGDIATALAAETKILTDPEFFQRNRSSKLIDEFGGCERGECSAKGQGQLGIHP